MKIKQIIFIYISAFWVSLFGSDIDPEMEEAIEASLKEQHSNPIANQQNLEYTILELEHKRKKLRETLQEKACIVCYHWNKEIKQARNKNDLFLELRNINETIKDIMKLIPHEVLDDEQINELTHFTTIWNTIQRGESKIIDPIENRKEETIINKIEKIESDIEIYNKALSKVNQYIKENEIINEEKERKKIEQENDPQLKEIKNIKETMYKKVSNYFKKKNFETKLKEAKENNNETAMNDIQKEIELIMQYCPHEFFTETQDNFLQIKRTWENAQREHRIESKIFNPTENNEENLENWKNTLKKLNIHINIDSASNTDHINQINKKLLNNLQRKIWGTQRKMWDTLRENSKSEKIKHLAYDTGIGLLTGFAVLVHNNFFKHDSSKKIHLLQKALIISGFTISGGIGENYFYKIKKYLPKKLKKDKPNKIYEQ